MATSAGVGEDAGASLNTGVAQPVNAAIASVIASSATGRSDESERSMSDHHERSEDGLLFSTDPARLDIDLIHDFLSRESYWVPGIHRELVERSLANSICFGVHVDGKQLGFARVVTDCVGFAYLADVFVIEAARARGIGKRLIAFVMDHPDLQRIRRFMLATRDAHDLYAKYGFAPLAHPPRFMERYDADALSR